MNTVMSTDCVDLVFKPETNPTIPMQLAKEVMNPEGCGVDNFPEQFSEELASIPDCGCGQSGKCVGARCGKNPMFVLNQKLNFTRLCQRFQLKNHKKLKKFALP